MSNKIQRITAKVASNVAIYAMMSANSYKKKSGRTRFDVQKLGWVHVDRHGEPTRKFTKVHKFSGLAYNIYEEIGSNKVVFAFRGSNNKQHSIWPELTNPPFHLQYRQARKAIKKYLSKNKNKDIVVTGHSLGGDIALSVSIHYGIKAFTFDPSPQAFDGIGNMNETAERIVVYQKGDTLQLARAMWKNNNNIVDKKNIFKCNYSDLFHGIKPNRGDILAKGLLFEGATVKKNLTPNLAYTIQ